ncbi:ABC transporter substrate-binding protein [Lysinibacillus sphaericus]|uniref:ABC transporter substrate-binding protein n=1 Tax=Lysinibacillus TaxID=400634 RepID=UPI00056C09CC|nr:ABC transporter substrate-binding protein [Lysinibacillus sphaericus]
MTKLENKKSLSCETALLFHLSDIDYITRSTQRSCQQILVKQHTFIIFITGSGTLTIDDTPYVVAQGKIFLLPPDSVMDFSDIEKYNYSFYKMSFTTIQLQQQIPTTYKESLFSDQIEYTIYPYARLIRLAEELYKTQLHQNPIKQQSLLYELLSVLFEYQLQKNQTFDASRAVEQTIDYLHKHYQEPLTVKQLASLAHVAQWQYSTIFQTLTGKKPLDYLTELRLEHAQVLLQQTNEPLKDIAQLVGFNDEYYFNRRFKQIIGMPPKQFARKQKQKVVVKDWTGHEVEIPSSPSRVIYHGETFGDMLIFDIQPIGGDKNAINKSFYKNRVPLVQDVNFPIDFEKSSELNPDLIIFTNADEQQYRVLSEIAPTVTHNSWGTLEERISLLGQWLGKKSEAEDWLIRFKKKEDMMWQQLQITLEPDETASVFIFDRGKRLFVMGCTGLSTALYHPYGFQPNELIKNLIQSGEGYEEIPLDLLAAYAGDRIFMLLTDNLESRLATEALINSSLWKSLPAVKKGNFYLVDARKWNYSDAYTREKLLGALPRLIGT